MPSIGSARHTSPVVCCSIGIRLRLTLVLARPGVELSAAGFCRTAPWHRNLSHLERDIPAVADDSGSNLHQLLPQRGQRPMLDRALSDCLAPNFGYDSLSMTFRHAAATRRARSRSRLARSYIWRLRAFRLLIWPSVCPLDHGSRRAARTACLSAFRPRARDARRLPSASLSHASRLSCSPFLTARSRRRLRRAALSGLFPSTSARRATFVAWAASTDFRQCFQ